MRRSCTFSNDRMREIERENQILLKKILTHGPSYAVSNNIKSYSVQVII